MNYTLILTTAVIVYATIKVRTPPATFSNIPPLAFGERSGMQCPHCQEQHPAEMRYCPNTGNPLDQTMITCPNCARPLMPGSQYCQSCGAPVRSKSTAELRVSKKMDLEKSLGEELVSSRSVLHRQGLVSDEILPQAASQPKRIILLGFVVAIVGLVVFAGAVMSMRPKVEINLIPSATNSQDISEATSTSGSLVDIPALSSPIGGSNIPTQTPAIPTPTPTWRIDPTATTSLPVTIVLPSHTPIPSTPVPPTPTASQMIPPTPASPYDLAFASDRDGKYRIYVMDADNPGNWLPLPMPDGYESAFWPTFCGDRIAFEAHDRSLTLPRWIFFSDLASQALQLFLPPGEPPDRTGLPGCSQDGRFFAYSAFRNFDWSLNIADMSSDQIIFSIPEGDYPMLGYPDWSSADDFLLWMGIRVGGTFDVNQTTLPSGSSGDETNLVAKGKYPALSPDGSKLAYICGNLYKLCIVEWSGGKILHEQTISYNKPFDGEMAPATAAWSADSQWIYFTSSVTGNWDIFRMHPDGADLENLTEDWSSDELMPATH